MDRRPKRDETGIAMITVILIMMIVSGLSILAVRTSIHNTEQSALDRHRIQSVSAAEGGIDRVMQTIEVSKPIDLPCDDDPDVPAVTGSLSGGAADTDYTVSVTYYATYPPTGAAMLCADIDANNAPKAAVVRAEGIAGAADRTRTMEALVQLNPIIGGFGSAIFSDASITLGNRFTLRGNDGNDANVYTNGNLICNNQVEVEGSFFIHGGHGGTLGSGTLSSSCTVHGEIWANHDITMSNTSRVVGDATSSTGSITLTNSGFRVLGDAKAAGTIADTARVQGTSTPNSASGPPPQTSLPRIEFVEQKWVDAGYDVHTFTACADAKAFLMSPDPDFEDTTKDVVRITSTCTLQFQSSDAEAVLAADLAIITDGSYVVQQSFAFRSTPSGAQHTMHVIIPWTKSDGTNHTCSGTTSRISTSNLTDMAEVNAFYYTPCTATIGNHTDFNGQILATAVGISNQFTMNFEPIDVPGAGEQIGHTVDVVYIRETRND